MFTLSRNATVALVSLVCVICIVVGVVIYMNHDPHPGPHHPDPTTPTGSSDKVITTPWNCDPEPLVNTGPGVTAQTGLTEAGKAMYWFYDCMATSNQGGVESFRQWLQNTDRPPLSDNYVNSFVATMDADSKTTPVILNATGLSPSDVETVLLYGDAWVSSCATGVKNARRRYSAPVAALTNAYDKDIKAGTSQTFFYANIPNQCTQTKSNTKHTFTLIKLKPEARVSAPTQSR
jgi:hypothetical protein